MRVSRPHDSRALSRSCPQRGYAPLHLLCQNESATAETILAMHALYPDAAKEKTAVCRHHHHHSHACVAFARLMRPLSLLSAGWFDASASSLRKPHRHHRDDPRSAQAQPGRRQGEDCGTSSPPPPLKCVCRVRTTHAPSLALVRSVVRRLWTVYAALGCASFPSTSKKR